MQIKKNYLAVTIGLLLFSSTLSAQQQSHVTSLINKANREYTSFRYVATIQLLEQVLKKDPANEQAIAMMANSYRKIKDYDQAAIWYTQLSTAKEIKPEWALQYAEVLANQKEYSESEKWYQKYQSLVSTDVRASAFVKAYPALGELAKDQGFFKVYYTDLNTVNAEYAPAFYKDGLIFSSNRNRFEVTKTIFGWDQTPFTDLYLVDQLSDIKNIDTDSLLKTVRRDSLQLKKLYRVNDDDTRPTSNDSRVLGNLSMPYKVDTLGQLLVMNGKARLAPGKINTKYHEGPAVALPDGSLLFTRNNVMNGKIGKSKEGVNKLKLYRASGPNWEQIEAFPFNNDEYSVGHPAVNKQGTLLIFASDMPGGFGGVDLYYSKRNNLNDAWSAPVNMGKAINTEGDEMFPSISADSLLFFASTGHPGLGGLDIFQISLNNEVPQGVPLNLGAPINSSVDDFGLIRSDKGYTGFFTSNRRGNDDIYSFVGEKRVIEKPVFALEGLVLNKETNQPIKEATVTLTEPNLGPISVKTNADGAFRFTLAEKSDYSLTGEKPGFMKALDLVTTNGLTKSEVLRKNLYMSEIVIGKAIKIENIFYDFDKYNIRPDAAIELDKLVKILIENPNIWIELGSHTDSRGNDLYNLKLSQNRANAAVAYIIGKGIAKERITAKGYGETMLVNQCANGVKCTEEEHQMNRRTEFKIIKQ